jgi:hypothetical protein
MLKFDTWPPEFDAIRWTDVTRAEIAKDLNNNDCRSLEKIGILVGSLLRENMALIDGNDAGFTVQRAAIELTQGWDPALGEVFMVAVADGAGVPQAGSRPFTYAEN